MLFLFVFSLLGLEIVKGQSLYEECKLKNGKTGKCIILSECNYAKNLLKTGRERPQLCDGFVRNHHNHAIVCCPVERSEIECHKYPKEAKICGGCNKAEAKEFSDMAAVGYGSRDSILWYCGGTLISEQFVLTAAHCVQSTVLGPAKWVRLGDLDLMSAADDASPQDFSVIKAFVHPNYTRRSHYHDIALLKLDRLATINSYVEPACLHIENSDPERLSIAGWGTTAYRGESSSHLLEATVFLVDNEKCRSRYPSSRRRLRDGIVPSLQVCAGHPEGKDTCPGDSGGPLQYKKKGVFRIFGVTSFGKGCAVEDSVGVYTRILPYRTWIEDIVWPEI